METFTIIGFIIFGIVFFGAVVWGMVIYIKEGWNWCIRRWRRNRYLSTLTDVQKAHLLARVAAQEERRWRRKMKESMQVDPESFGLEPVSKRLSRKRKS